MDKDVLSLFDVELFEYEYVDMLEDGVQYSPVIFKLDSLKKYNGRVVSVTTDFNFIIFDDQSIHEEVSFSLIENIEFRELLYKKYYTK